MVCQSLREKLQIKMQEKTYSFSTAGELELCAFTPFDVAAIWLWSSSTDMASSSINSATDASGSGEKRLAWEDGSFFNDLRIISL